jgi:glycosyltransferase involved in cell wall biosynthesis
MQKGHPVQFLGPQETQPQQYEWADVLYIQCLYAPDAYQFYASQKKAGKGIIIDFDDDYINIPEDSPEQTEIIDKSTGESYSFPPHLRSVYVQMFVQLADVLVVTTEPLKQLYSPWAKNIQVIPNCVSKDMERDIPKGKNDKVRLLWSGSNSHLPDLELLKEPLSKIASKYGDRVEFHFQGGLPFEDIFTDFPIITHDMCDFENYLNVIQDINPDIALAPLVDNSFNNCKSNLKFSQMTLMEAAFIGSKLGPYLDIEEYKEGFLAKNEKDWVEKISKLIEDENLRKSCVANAKKLVRNNYYIDKHINRWQSLLTG